MDINKLFSRYVSPSRLRRAALLFASCLLWQSAAIADSPDNRRVLFLNELGPSSAAVPLVDHETRDVIERQTMHRIEPYVEYLKTTLFPNPRFQQKIYYLFDRRVLERWYIKSRNLPARSIVLNRQPTPTEAYDLYIFGIFGGIPLLVQILPIILLTQRAKKRATRRYLNESEARLREVPTIAQCGSWICALTQEKARWSDEMCCILGLSIEKPVPIGRLTDSGDDLQYIAKMRTISEANQPSSEEPWIVRPNGEERIVVESGRPRYDSHNKSLSVVGTLPDVTEIRFYEQMLRESEERFRSMADGAPIMMWMADVDKLCTDFNRGWLAFTGRSIEEELGNGWATGVHPDDLQRCMKLYIEAFDNRAPFSVEYRLRRHDGEYHWISDTGSPRFLPDGTFAGYIGCCLDIHDRKEEEIAKRELCRRLMVAQEEERGRIARELHDGIGQEIALLGIQMQRASTSPGSESGSNKSAIKIFSDKLTEIGIHVGRLSHQLHSSELEYLGLTVAITKLCREFSEEFPIKVTCACSNIPRSLANDIALTFLRIVQESLRNVAKHSGARTVQVEMTGTVEGLSLSVRDDGSGFNVEESKRAAGLGLISMRERIYLLGGVFTIDSTVGVGTSVRAVVPFKTATP
ncbi:PAS domain-containing sensor histidine kinase [Edaphobacter modestus]|uniref:Oxygen sensor histidine kinase NreB n=1 Tax=Edaphobacter modestus TaxID=388466 RepID=A0A4Q7YP88_9BACT|nr:PAS domain S-box protein [Edaphobacter modestus]RZU39230.1 PAS domain S-box-containing protein [Edaphobacter modestus]